MKYHRQGGRKFLQSIGSRMKIERITAYVCTVLIIFFTMGCSSTSGEPDALKTYEGAKYTIEYPAAWADPEDPVSRADDYHITSFSGADDSLSFTITSERLYPVSISGKDYLAELITDIKDETEVRDCLIGGSGGYKIESADNNGGRTIYLVQQKDVVFELNFEYQADDGGGNRHLIESIAGSFKFTNFDALSGLKDSWNLYEAGNLAVYYPDDSVVYQGIEKWAQRRVEAFDYICGYLDVKWEYEPVKMYIFNSKAHGGQYGLYLGFAKPEYNEVLTEHVQTPGHELAHCISYYMNNGARVDSALINEGLATYLNMSGSDYHAQSRAVLRKKEYKLNLLGDDFRGNDYAYTLGASFVKYLIDGYGLEVFKEFFAQNKYSEEEGFIIFYGREGSLLVDEWTGFLKTY